MKGKRNVTAVQRREGSRESGGDRNETLAEAVTGKCSERACPFPAWGNGIGLCRAHLRQFKRPDIFYTKRVSVMVADRLHLRFREILLR